MDVQLLKYCRISYLWKDHLQESSIYGTGDLENRDNVDKMQNVPPVCVMPMHSYHANVTPFSVRRFYYPHLV